MYECTSVCTLYIHMIHTRCCNALCMYVTVRKICSTSTYVLLCPRNSVEKKQEQEERKVKVRKMKFVRSKFKLKRLDLAKIKDIRTSGAAVDLIYLLPLYFFVTKPCCQKKEHEIQQQHNNNIQD